VQTDVETLTPTRVKLKVEVPFDDLKPSVDAAYREIGQQVQLKGFRPGKVPARLLDQHVGRGTVLQQALNDALPSLYTDAVRESEVAAIGQPEVEVTDFTDGEQLVFTAEVDVRPDFEIPSYDGLQVTVDDAEPSEEEIDEQIASLRERFAVLHGADRPVATGDYVMLDLEATVDGEPVEEAAASGLSYEVGSASLVDGLDDAIVGHEAGETVTFPTSLVAGEHAGREASVAATIRTVREKELPELDDDFAQTASEFDTLAELREDYRERFGRVRRMQQGLQARDRAIEELVARVDAPVPDQLLADEIESRRQALADQLDEAGLTLEGYLEHEGQTAEEYDAEVDRGARQAILAQFVLDAIARKEEVGVTEADLTELIVRRASRQGVSPEELAQQLMQAGQLPSLMAEAARSKAIALVLESATVTDSSGRPVDLDALRDDATGSSEDGGTDETADAGAAEDSDDSTGGQPAGDAGHGASGEPAATPS
jgi:trigger factor